MAQRGQKDLLARLADAAEEGLTRLGATPGMDRVAGVMGTMREQMEALSTRVRGIDALERRIEELERQVAKLSKPSSSASSSRKTTNPRKTAAKKASSPSAKKR